MAPFQPYRTLVLLVCVALAVPSLRLRAQEEAAPTKWTNPKGQVIDAEFVRLVEGAVILRLSSTGQETTVPLSKLSLESHLQALKMADPEAFTKELVKAPVPVEAFEPEFKLSLADVAVSPFGTDPTIDQFMATVKSELKRGNMFVFWHMMPPKMQADIDTIVSRTGTSLGNQTLGQIRSALGMIRDIASKKAEFIMNSTVVPVEPESVDSMQKDWPRVVAITNVLAEPSLWDPANFQPGQTAGWLARILSELGPLLQSDQAGDTVEAHVGGTTIRAYTELNFEIVSQSADRAEIDLKFAEGLEPKRIQVQKVGNVWVVPAFMNEFRKGLDQGLMVSKAGFNPAPINAAFFPINAILGQLDQAETQEEFDTALAAIQPMIQGLNPASFTQPMAGGGQPAQGTDPGANSGGNSGGNRPGRPSFSN